MPAGPQLCRLQPSARRTDGNGSTGAPWPTPLALDRVRDEKTMAKCATFRKRNANQNTVPLHLGEVAALTAGWATPRATDGEKMTGLSIARREAGRSPDALPEQARMAAWPTPRGPDQARSQPSMESVLRDGDQGKLERSVIAAAWPTPNHRDHKGSLGQGCRERGGHQSSLPADLAAFGAPPSGGSASTEKRGALNPEFVCWLMGFPTAWVRCAASATRSSHRLQRNSSKR